MGIGKSGASLRLSPLLFSLRSFSPPLLPLTRPRSPLSLSLSFFSPLLFLPHVSLASLAVLFAPSQVAHAHPAKLRDCFNTPDGQNCDPVPTTVGIYRRDLSRVFTSRLEVARAHYVAQRNVSFSPLFLFDRMDYRHFPRNGSKGKGCISFVLHSCFLCLMV